MKKYILTLLIITLFTQQANSCGYWDPEESYFNLFVQELVLEDEYFPFLFTTKSSYYGDGEWSQKKKPELLDENIENWVTYFNNELTYEETNALVKIIRRKHIRNWKKGTLTHVLSKQKGANFYKKYREGFDYLAYAKYLEPYMTISYVPSENDWYNEENEKNLDASDLDYDKVLNVLIKSYNLTENQDIKLRYGYQIVRLNHYTRKYKAAVDAFNQYVKPLKKDTPIFWYAVNQCAGAVRGLGFGNEANQMFFQVFIHSRNKKSNAYSSINFGGEGKFQNILNNATTKEEQNMAYFLLAYDNYSNPTPIMEKMMEIDTESSILKVLTARSLNQIERLYLPTDYYCGKENCTHGKLLPIKLDNEYPDDFAPSKDYIYELEKIVSKARNTSQDEFWDLALAHLYFLQKKYAKSNQVLPVNTTNPFYKKQVKQMSALNYIVSQDKIDNKVEERLIKDFPNLFNNKENGNFTADAKDFIRDILANRYFLQNDMAKSFLMNTKISDFQYNLNLDVLKKVDAFLQKKNKNTFEQKMLSNANDMGNALAFIQVIYGDIAMRNGNFEKAVTCYKKGENFKGIQRAYYYIEPNSWESVEELPNDSFNGFKNISHYIFGQNRRVFYNSTEESTMNLAKHSFNFIPSKMDKLELAEIMVKLKKIGKGKSKDAVTANTFIGNVLYNTSEIGYYRHLFVMDINNANGSKFRGGNHYDNASDNAFYANNINFGEYISNHHYDLSIAYYEKALNASTILEEQANILFQMAKAEQGNYYNFDPDLEYPKWDDENYNTKRKAYYAKLKDIKNKKFSTYFNRLKNDYSDTETVYTYQKSCSYFNHYMVY